MENFETVDNSYKKIEGDPDIDKYVQEMERDLKITKVNIKEKSMNVSSLRCKWLNYLYFEKDNLSRCQKHKDLYMSKKNSENKFSDPLLKMKSQLSVENGDEKMVKLNNMMKMIKNRIEYLERAQDIISDLSRQIYNTIELMKLEMR